MKNSWLDKVDKALRKLGFDRDFIDQLSDCDKDSIILEHYLYMLTHSDFDVILPGSTEEMAEYIIDHTT